MPVEFKAECTVVGINYSTFAFTMEGAILLAMNSNLLIQIS